MTTHLRSALSLGLLLTLSLFLVACGGDPKPPPVPPMSPPSAMSATEEPGTTGTTGAEIGTSFPQEQASGDRASQAPSLSDAEIVTIVATFNAAEIEQGKMAQKNAKNPNVKRYADAVVKGHESADKKQAKLQKKHNLAPSDSALSRDVVAARTSDFESLKNASGPDFDRSYVDSQVREHQKMLLLIDERLMPQAQSDDVKVYIDSVRTTIVGHLRDATDLQRSMAANPK